MPKRVVLKEPLLTFLDMLDEATDQADLLGNLVNFGLGKSPDTENMYTKVKVAFEYLTSDSVRDAIFIDSKE